MTCRSCIRTRIGAQEAGRPSPKVRLDGVCAGSVRRSWPWLATSFISTACASGQFSSNCARGLISRHPRELADRLIHRSCRKKSRADSRIPCGGRKARLPAHLEDPTRRRDAQAAANHCLARRSARPEDFLPYPTSRLCHRLMGRCAAFPANGRTTAGSTARRLAERAGGYGRFGCRMSAWVARERARRPSTEPTTI